MTTCSTFTVADLTPTFPWQMNGGILELKEGGSATASIYFDLWDVTVGGPVTGTPGNLSGDLVAEAFAAAGDVSTNDFTPTDFFFDTPVILTVGDSYVVTVTSATDGAGSGQYFIKGADTITIQDSSSGGGDPLAPPANTPEPSSIMMMLGRLLLAGFTAGRARRSAAA